MAAPDRNRATAELLGALAYGELRAVEAAARLIALAPDLATADIAVDAVEQELGAYRALRYDLDRRVTDPLAAIEVLRGPFDDFFDRAPLHDLFGASVFFALGLPIAADFARALAPVLDDDVAGLVTDALAGRDELEAAAVAQLRTQLVDGPSRERARQLTADLLGRALTSYQDAMATTDSLRILFEQALDGGSAESRVKRLAMDVLTGHRRRALALGLDDLDEGSDDPSVR